MARANLTNALRKRMLSVQELKAMVDDRLRPDAIEQGEPVPAIRYRVLRDAPERTLSGPSTLRMNRTQFDCYADSRAEADELAGYVEDALNGLTGEFEGIYIDDCFLDNSYADSHAPRKGSDQYRYFRTLDFEVSYQTNTVED
ncbi:MAG: DUF3168 domain-containing protein [Planctomycetota bacterium]